MEIADRRRAIAAYQLTGLTLGQRYLIGVRGYAANGYVGPMVTKIVSFVQIADDDSDGLPDQWAEVFDVSGGSVDFDGDGLTNAQEYQNGTLPNRADSDDDGFYDAEEIKGKSDPAVRTLRCRSNRR